MRKTLMMDLFYKSQVVQVREQTQTSLKLQSLRQMYSLKEIQDLSVLVLHQVVQYQSELNYLIT